MPKVNQTHPEYNRHVSDWRRARDAVDGEQAIKAKGETYLPKTPAQVQNDPGGRRYEAYKLRARFPDLVAPTLRALNGALHDKKPVVELPTRMRPMLEAATVDGLDLFGFARRFTREILMTGRYGIFTNSPAENGQMPLLAGYTAESIISWQQVVDEQGRSKVDRVIIEERSMAPGKDGFELVPRMRWRVLNLRVPTRLEGEEVSDGPAVFEVDVYEKKDTDPRAKDDSSGIVLTKTIRPTGFGSAMDTIPFVFGGSIDILPEPDDAMLVPLARLAVSVYQQDADYRATLYQTSQPTPVLTGMDKDDERLPDKIGAGAMWVLPEGANAFFLEVSGAGLSSQRQAIQDDLAAARELGAKMLESGKAAESGEALRLRRGIETASLVSVALASGLAIQQALQYGAMWLGLDPKAVRYMPNLDFIEQYADPAFVRELRESWMSGMISHDTALDLLREYEIIPVDRSNEEERELIDAQSPLGGFDDPGEPDDGQSDKTGDAET